MPQLSRRLFHKLAGFLGLGLLARALQASEPATNGASAVASSSSAPEVSPATPPDSSVGCKDGLDIVSAEDALTCPSELCLMWVDGMAFEASRMGGQGQVAFLLKFTQSETEYIDKVVFADESKRTLGVRYLSASDKITLGYPPYLIFDSVDLAASNRYFLVFQQRTANGTKIYRRTFPNADLKRSRLAGAQLPAAMSYELKRDHNGGVVTNPFYFRTSLDRSEIAKHMVRARLIELGRNDEFQMQIDFLHDDVDEKHYMRHFIVTDPVGRLLGAVKRGYNDGITKSIIVQQMSEAERIGLGLIAENVAKINDCPYLMVFVDDVKEALARAIIWLR